jgi:hypothetical protein
MELTATLETVLDKKGAVAQVVLLLAMETEAIGLCVRVKSNRRSGCSQNPSPIILKRRDVIRSAARLCCA